MNEYLQLTIYIITGFTGGAWHWVKKRYVDKTVSLNFQEYLLSDLGFTIQATGAILMTEYGLSMLNTTGVLHLPDIIGAVTAGYMADSHLNRCNDIGSSPKL